MSKTNLTTELTRNNRVIFSDFFTSFSRNAITGQLNKKTNEDSVKQSIRNLLLTNKGERLFQPRVGSNLTGMLFENVTTSTVTMIEEAIYETIENFEPRAELISVNVDLEPDYHTINATIYFRIINNEDVTTLNITLERTR